MSKAGLLYTAQQPWPVRGQTADYRVSITQPGVVVPIFAEKASFSGTTIPIRLDEMRTERARAGYSGLDKPTGF